MKTVALCGGSYNPPHNAHIELARLAAAHFGQAHVIPCGARPDKPTVGDIDPTHRAALADLAYRDIANATVILEDLELGEFTRTHDLDRRYRAEGQEPWHVVGSDLIAGGAEGQSEIQQSWKDGERIWRNLNWAVVGRSGHPFTPSDLPPHAVFLGHAGNGRSTDIRSLVFNRQPYQHLVPSAVADYIERHGLYRGQHSTTRAAFGSSLVPLVIADLGKPEAIALAKKITDYYGSTTTPNVIVVLGGDGFFMETLRQNWRRRLPFMGLNLGHFGHFMNKLPAGSNPLQMLQRTDLVVRQSPILHVEWENLAGERHTTLGVNDAWLERDSGQSAWLRLVVDGETRIEKVSGDGILVASALGSTGYAYSLGATPLFDRPGLVVAGIVPSRFLHWHPLHEKANAVIRMESLDVDKRPVTVFVDSVEQGRARSLTVRTSRIAAVEIIFTPEDDLEQKRLRYQYPDAHHS